MEAITRAEALSYMEQAKRLKTTLLRSKQSNEEGISAAFTTGAGVVIGGGMAWLNERFGESNADLGGALSEIVIPGTKAPADVVAGFVAHGAAFMGAFGKHAEHGHNVASALITGWAVRNAMAMGKDAKASAGKTSSGYSPNVGRKSREAA